MLSFQTFHLSHYTLLNSTVIGFVVHSSVYLSFTLLQYQLEKMELTNSNQLTNKLNHFTHLQIIRTTVATLKHNNWTQFSIIYQVDQESTMETLRAEAHKENMTINHVRPLNKERLSLTFQETKNTTRSRMA